MNHRYVAIGVLAAAALALYSCGPSPVEKSKTDNGIVVSKMAQIEGCNVYRLTVGYTDSYVWTTICPGTLTSEAIWQQSCGKNCMETVTMHTARKK